MEKKLQRDINNKVIGGVCAGLANYFGTDVSLMRLLLAFMVLFAGTGIGLYLILWVVMPAGDAQATDSIDAVMPDTPQTSKANKGSLVVGLILIGMGALGLLHRFVPAFNWQMVWPVLLIVLGLVLLIPKKDTNS
jgi:phage shock protein PspC (stress-responsive transcriptional regulator)